mmetsp:Transcript_6892/g.11848  ORF Transcript_6892/g.11848 Transcript_6892/m.11848 type:complete len:185 (-) Transcript_6892:687-1241(-)
MGTWWRTTLHDTRPKNKRTGEDAKKGQYPVHGEVWAVIEAVATACKADPTMCTVHTEDLELVVGDRIPVWSLNCSAKDAHWLGASEVFKLQVLRTAVAAVLHQRRYYPNLRVPTMLRSREDGMQYVRDCIEAFGDSAIALSEDWLRWCCTTLAELEEDSPEWRNVVCKVRQRGECALLSFCFLT